MKYRVGVDIGGMSIKVALMDSDGKLSNKVTEVTPLNSNDKLTECIFSLIDRVLQENNVSVNDIESIGIGSPGIINPNNGEIVYASNLGVEHLEIASKVKNKYNIKCFVENDANCAVLGEYYFGNAKGAENVLMVTLGTGVGSGIIINGKLLVAKNGGGTEGGHITIVVDGKHCACGENGCYEKYASTSALIEQTKKAIETEPNGVLANIAKDMGDVNGKVVFEAVNKGDKLAKQVLNTYIKYVASGIIGIANIFRPEIVLIGGGVSAQNELLIKPLNKYVNEHLFGNQYLPPIDVKQAKLKNDAGILGAAMLGVN